VKFPQPLSSPFSLLLLSLDSGSEIWDTYTIITENYHSNIYLLFSRVADPDQGSDAFLPLDLDPG
jgi:hypothetical protein